MATVVELNPVDGLQLYEFPKIDVVPIVDEVVIQFKFLSVQALAVGHDVYSTHIPIGTTEFGPVVFPFAVQ